MIELINNMIINVGVNDLNEWVIVGGMLLGIVILNLDLFVIW